MKPPHMSEETLQELVAAWLDLWGVLWWHTPNGAFYGKHAKVIGQKMIRQGLKKGVPDCLIFEEWKLPRQPGRYGGFGLAIELKTKGGYPTKAQKEIMAELRARGWRCVVCRSLAEVQEACKALRPLSGRAAPY